MCLGAHADDIEIGCGGSVIQLLRTYPHVEADWVVLSAEASRGDEARTSASLFLEGATRSHVVVQGFRDRYFPYGGEAIKEFFDELGSSISPHVIFTHSREDRHQDHRTVSDLTWNTWRDHLILEYEVPKYDGDLGTPNCYMPLDASVAARKVELLERCFPSQKGKHWFDEEVFRGLMRLRGLECRAPEGYAEAFHGRKVSLL